MARVDEAALIAALRLHRPARASALAAALATSQPSVSRALRALGDRLVVRGAARRTRYALRRAIRGRIGSLPVYAVDANGGGAQIATLDCLEPEGSALGFQAPFPWPLRGNTMQDGWFGGLPYPIVDMRPQGFLGRRLARQHARLLGVAEDPEAWGDDDVVHVLAVVGTDQPGDLILGEAAYRAFLDERGTATRRILAEAEIETVYPEFAAEALAGGPAGSSLAGEFPKFVATRATDHGPTHVLVKFSGADDTPAVRRWADLLVCEHLAAGVLRDRLGVTAVTSRIVRFAGRTFLEVERFDRHGAHGRSPVCTLESLGAALLGAPAPWPQAAAWLHREGLLSEADVQAVARLYWFGRLIGNTDMHDGNLAFRPGLRLAPAYDMLPMVYAPLRGGEFPERRYAPPLPLPGEAPAWRQAAEAAREYWRRCAHDERVSALFRALCAANGETLTRTIAAA